jgi:nitrogen-specific signal transduction histidine kinase
VYIALDSELTITHFNAGAERVFARAARQVVGKRFREVFTEAGGATLAAKLEEAVKRQNDSFAKRRKISRGRMAVRSIGSAFGRTLCRPGMPIRASNSSAL